MQQQVDQVHDVDELKQRLIDIWHGFEQSVINVWKSKISAFNITPYYAYFILPIVFVNFVNIKQELLRYVQQNFASFVFCVLQGSAVTHLKCVEMYDMYYVANFMENTTVKNFENLSTSVKLMNECIVAQFLLRHSVDLLGYKLSCVFYDM